MINLTNWWVVCEDTVLKNRRYLINGREVTPEEFAHYRATGQLPGNAEVDGKCHNRHQVKQDGVLPQN